MDAFVITGPTSGIGKATVQRMVSPDRVIILVGRNQAKLDMLREEIAGKGQIEIILCDFSDVLACRHAADELIDLCKTRKYNLRGILNNVGVSQAKPTTSAQGWDTTFATNFLGPLAWTDRLLPHLPDGVLLLFATSKTEDPEQPLPRKAGMRGGRFLSVDSSVKGIWNTTEKDGGPSKLPGADGYCTSKQCVLAAVMVLAREHPDLRISAVEPGWIPGTGLSRDAGAVVSFLARHVLSRIAANIAGGSTVSRASELYERLLLDTKDTGTGLYYDENGDQMQPSALVRQVSHQELVMTQARALLERV